MEENKEENSIELEEQNQTTQPSHMTKEEEIKISEDPNAQTSTDAIEIPVEEEKIFEESTADLPELNKWRIICLTCGMIGNQLIWALQNGNASSYFLSMGMEEYLVGIAWLAGPVGGIAVQPTIGTFSDKSQLKWGRRRPFMVLSLIAVIICCLIFSNAWSIGQFFGDSGSDHFIGLCVAVTSFWALDCAINGLQSMLRALYVDIAPPSQHSEGMAWFSLMNSLGNTIGYGLGVINYVQFGFVSNVQALYILGIGVLVFTVSVTMISGKEQQYIPSEEEKHRNEQIREKSSFGRLNEIYTKLLNMMKLISKFPSYLRLIFTVQFFSWFAWFIIMLYVTVWVGTDIYGGDPNASEGTEAYNNYHYGIQVGNAALMIQSVFSMIYALILPYILSKFDFRIPYGIAQLMQGILMGAAYWCTEPWQAILLISFLAIPWSSTWTIPWSLTSTALTHSPHKALYLGTLNLSQVLPEIVCGIYVNLFLYFKDDVGLLITIGGVFALFSFVFVPFIPTNKILALGNPLPDIIDEENESSSAHDDSGSDNDNEIDIDTEITKSGNHVTSTI